MSIVADARTYADSALEQGKSTLTFASGRLVSLTSDVRVRATTVIIDTKELALGAFSLALRQAYATIGASDAIFATITKRTTELPAEAKRTATKLVDTTKGSVTKAGDLAESVTTKSQELTAKAQEKVVAVAGDLKERGEEALEAARKLDLSATTTVAKEEVEGRVGQVKTVFSKLADRGEQVAAELRQEPLVQRVIGDADKIVERAANEVTAVAQKVRARASSSAPMPPAKKAPAKKAPAKKAPAAKVAASEG